MRDKIRDEVISARILAKSVDQAVDAILALIAENTAGVSGSSEEFDDLHDVRECNATRVDAYANSLEPVEDRLEKITDGENLCDKCKCELEDDEIRFGTCVSCIVGV